MPVSDQLTTDASHHFDCQTCGACCSYSSTWPRFTLEDDAALDLIPPALVAENGAGMRCHGNRCAALKGEVGRATSCSIYAVRPDVCRACLPGDEACLMARSAAGLGDLPKTVSA
jgi:Fe-S-cluster containining protein